MKKYIVALLLCAHLSITPIHFVSITTPGTSALGLYIPHLQTIDIQSEGWHYFHDAAFKLPEVLELCRSRNIPFVFIVPNCYATTATIDPTAPITEGIRVGLAWVSAYNRFKELSNVDVRIVLTDSTDSVAMIQGKIAKILQLSFEKTATPEADIQQRLVQFTDSTSDCTATIAPFDYESASETITMITPQFTTLKKRILITGGAGFLGSYIAKAFIEKEYQVIVLDDLSCCSGDNIASLRTHPDFNFYQVDVTHPFDVEGPIDIVAHVASVPSPEFYYRMPLQTLKSGLHGTRETLELAHRKHARFFFSSTSEVYGDPEVNPQPETYAGCVSPIGKRSQYDQSKRGAETLIKLYYEKYSIDVRIARIFNTYGPGMQLHDGRVMTNFIRAALDNKPMLIYGTGNQTRSPIYVEDMVRGLVALIESDTISSLTELQQRIFNIGNPEELSINQVATIVNDFSLKYEGRKVPINHIPQFDTTDPKMRKPDISYIKRTLGFTPHISFEEGIEKMYLFYKKQILTN